MDSKEGPRNELHKDENRRKAGDKFKETFKKYKTCKLYSKFETFNEIFDPAKADEFIKDGVCVKKPVTFGFGSDGVTGETEIPAASHKNCETYFGLTRPTTWDIFEFSFPEGLIFIKNPFTDEGQRYWITRCLKDYPVEPTYVTNITNLLRRKLINAESGVDAGNKYANPDEFYQDLRWITFGYHHDWDTKVYREDYRCDFPADLADLTKYISLVLGYKDFVAEAAIVNYYHLDSTLSGHVDRSERNQFAPLFSFSFGQTALFLIGGEMKDKTPLGIYLQSGDIAVMAGRSRLSYHGVPKVLPARRKPWRVFTDTDTVENSFEDSTTCQKKPKLCTEKENCCLCQHVKSSKFQISNAENVLLHWSEFFEDYISKSRINLNIRQVLFPGQKSLEDEIS